MNRLILITGFFIVLSSSMFGISKKDAVTHTESEYRAILSQLLSAKTNKEISDIIKEKDFWSLTNRKDLESLRIEADLALSKKGYCAMWKSYVLWKNISAKHREELGADKAYPKCIYMAGKYNCMIDIGAFASRGASLEELIECLNEYISFPDKCSMEGNCFDTAKKGIQKAAILAIKRALRKQGKSFVTKDGVNPCEEYMEKLNKALNAPRFSGLNEWLEELGFIQRIDATLLPSEAKVEALKDSIYYGEKNPSNIDKSILSVCLGVDGYNEFVKKYNGE